MAFVLWPGRGCLRPAAWPPNRVALITVVLGLLVAAPAILGAAHVRSPWILAGASASAAVIGVFSLIWLDRYRRMALRSDEQELGVQASCLVLGDGQLPTVRDVTDPVKLGVNQAARGVTSGPPAYIPRDVDDELRKRLEAGGFVLLVGDSTAGKSRTAFEALRATLADHVLIYPSNRDGIVQAILRGVQERKCVLWLDELENYLGAGGLVPAQIVRFLSGKEHHRVILATIRTFEQNRLIYNGKNDGNAHQVLRDIRQALDQAYVIRVPRLFSSVELQQARARDSDLRIAEAIRHAASYGIAEYLAAGPKLLRCWDDARTSVEGPNIRGAALVTAAVDLRRAGFLSPISRTLLDKVHNHYLQAAEYARAIHEPLHEAWEWATCQRYAANSLLRAVGPGRLEVFEYLLDAVQLRAGSSDQVPEQVVRNTIDYCDPADADSLAATAYAQGRYSLAEYGWRRVARANERSYGPDHPGAWGGRIGLANALRAQGKLDEAEAENRSVVEVLTRVLGADHPETLRSRSNLGSTLRDQGRLDAAETENRSVVEALTRVLGADHPDVLDTRNNLAVVLEGLGRMDEAKAQYRVVIEARTRTLGPNHPDTAQSRYNLAVVSKALES